MSYPDHENDQLFILDQTEESIIPDKGQRLYLMATLYDSLIAPVLVKRIRHLLGIEASDDSV